MKVIGLNGSPRSSLSRTGQLVKAVLESVKNAGAQVEYFDISKLKVAPCIACDKCHKVGYCIQKDDSKKIIDAIMASDGVVIGSPVYNYQVTAQLKAWFDRLGNVIHCLKFSGKYGAVVATSGGAGETETADYLEAVLKRTGIQCVGRLAKGIDEDGLLTEESPLFKEAKELGQSLVAAISEKKTYPEQLAEMDGLKGFFCYLVGKHKDTWTAEYEYFKEKGWL